MADVFVSCVRADHDRVRPMAERLQSLGYSVYWQGSGADAARELETARAVIAAWSGEARNSTWMCALASRAADASKLLQVRLDASPQPPPFDALPAADMSSDRVEWGPLEADLAKLVRGGGAADAGATPRAGLLATTSTAGAPKLLTIALATSLLAFFGALSAARNGVMSPDQLQLALTGMIGVAGASAALSAHRLFTIARSGG